MKFNINNTVVTVENYTQAVEEFEEFLWQRKELPDDENLSAQTHLGDMRTLEKILEQDGIIKYGNCFIEAI